MHQTRIIINADDFGISEKVNKSIIDLMISGNISSATLIANGEAIHEAIESKKNFPNISYGIHLNCSEGSPFHFDDNLQKILDKNGHYNNNSIKKIGLKFNILKSIYKDWSKQIIFLQKHGLEISHLDSHHHMHTRPILMPVIRKIQKEFKIYKIRNTMNLYGKGNGISMIKSTNKKLWQIAMRANGAKMTDYFSSLDAFVSSKPNLSNKTIELMVHPGHKDYEHEKDILNKYEYIYSQNNLINYNKL